VILALAPADLWIAVPACSGAVALAVLVHRHRAKRPVLRAPDEPLRPAKRGELLVLALLVLMGSQLGGLLVLGGGWAGRIVGVALPLAAALYAAYLVRRDVLHPRGSLPWRIGMGLLHLWAALPLVYVTFLVARCIGYPEQQQVGPIRDREEGWQAMIASAVLVAPVAEEVCFRGLVYPALRGVLGVRGAIVLASFAFAIVHQPTVWVPMAILGAFLAWLVETTRSLAPVIAAHMAFNFYNVAMLFV
jgi:membrane protease YdiL (CAAX protease family)